ncbi:MAG: ParB N-terminal domain-containing protein [Lachnospiraceae bacterium]|nr:ParB N-terminal domain-containing protein [Lachnospiraceae bacterium]
MKPTAELKMLPVTILKPAAYNPRKKLKPGDKEYEKIRNSIEEFGFADPLVVNADMTIIGGHQRLTVAKAMGYTEVPCAVVDVDKTREKALNIALNKITGAWDDALLADLLKDISDSDFDLGKTGFDAPEIDELFNNVHSKDVKEDDFDEEAELERPAFSKEGDIWHLGRHRVICGDSTLPETYEKLLGKVKVNLICTDPPYMVNLESSSGKIKNDDLDDVSALEFLSNAFKCFHEAMADDASIYVFYATAKTRIFHDAFEDSGFKVGAGLVWKKDRLVLTRTDWKYIHEPIIWGWRKDGRHRWYGDQKQTTVFEFPRLKSSKEEGFGHPSSKPVQLIAYLIKQCTMTNGLVLDGFLGSASTLIACEQLDRTCYGVELEPKFVDVAVKRYLSFKEGNSSDIYVMRDSQKLRLEEVVQLTDEEAPDGTE